MKYVTNDDCFILFRWNLPSILINSFQLPSSLKLWIIMIICTGTCFLYLAYFKRKNVNNKIDTIFFEKLQTLVKKNNNNNNPHTLLFHFIIVSLSFDNNKKSKRISWIEAGSFGLYVSFFIHEVFRIGWMNKFGKKWGRNKRS